MSYQNQIQYKRGTKDSVHAGVLPHSDGHTVTVSGLSEELAKEIYSKVQETWMEHGYEFEQ